MINIRGRYRVASKVVPHVSLVRGRSDLLIADSRGWGSQCDGVTISDPLSENNSEFGRTEANEVAGAATLQLL